MRKKVFLNISLVFMMLFLVSCTKGEEYEKYDIEFFDAFDTITQIVIYEKDEKFAGKELKNMQKDFESLHKLFDKYNDYEGINNIKTINDNAGIKAVVVDEKIYNLIEDSIDHYNNISTKTNIAIGPAVDLWNEYRDLYEEGKTKEQVEEKMGSYIPTDEELNSLREFMNMDDIVLNKEEQSIYLKKKGMQLDVGSIAKGYATELVAQEAEKRGITSALISAGGNVRIIGSPKNGRDYFSVAVQNPYKKEKEENPYLTVLGTNENSVVTSGDYQRYFTVDDKRYCHIIDPDSLKPERIYRSVTIITKDSGLCDYLSTALFLSSYEEGLKICEDLGVEAIWAFPNGEVLYTKGAEKLMVEQ